MDRAEQMASDFLDNEGLLWNSGSPEKDPRNIRIRAALADVLRRYARAEAEPVIAALDRQADSRRARDWTRIPGLPETWPGLVPREKAAVLRDILADDL